MNFKTLSAIVLISVFSGIVAPAADSVFGKDGKYTTAEIGFGGNAYVTKNSGAAIDNSRGLVNWKDPKAQISAYFKLSQPEPRLQLSIRARGQSTIGIIAGTKKFKVDIKSKELEEIPVGEISFSEAGYQRIRIAGLKKKGDTFGEISAIIIKGIAGKINYVHDFENYWGRRGPSVHMNYTLPRGKKIEYFYNEVTVPEGQDALGTYFMLNGFGQGYCGIQVNSPTERRVLFSVWSPFNTQNPKDIPEDERVVKLRQGKDVHIGEFGNEGSGGQSFLRFMWKAGTTYSVLTRVHPDGNGNTDYTAYFFTPEDKKWHLIASFRRPKTDTWYTGTHSFLENFNPNQGFISREVHFGNQWVRDSDGKWHELTEGTFTCDATGNAKVRLDYTGGVTEDKKHFFLKNCGFINENTPSYTKFERKPSGQKPPQIDFAALEKL